MAGIQETKKIWFNGNLVNWKDAKVHVMTHTLHYGSGVFEGIRCYHTSSGTAIFRLQDHVERLFNSASAIRMKIPYTKKQIFDAIVQTVKVNKLKSGYIRPVCYFGYGQMGLDTSNCKVEVAILCIPFGAYLGEEALRKGIKVKITSMKRYHGPLNKAKINGNYYHSSLAKREANDSGYDEGLMLDDRGLVSEATGENIFLIKDSVLITPKEGSILLGITRASVMTLAKEMGIKVIEKDIARDELFTAQEIFLSGTAAEITPVRQVDSRVIGIGSRGEITEKLQKAYFNVVMGKDKKYIKWLTFV